MAFPSIVPSSRSFSPGDFPVKKIQSQSGEETRILYGSKRTRMSLALTYKNVTDAKAEEFLDHYHEMNGTYKTFSIGTKPKEGWAGNADALEAGAWGNAYRYSGPPNVVQVASGISTVQVKLIGVL